MIATDGCKGVTLFSMRVWFAREASSASIACLCLVIHVEQAQPIILTGLNTYAYYSSIIL